MTPTADEPELFPKQRSEWRYVNKKGWCRRNLKAGPGSCWYWWEGCPDRVHNCFLRHRKEQLDALDKPTP